MIKNFIFVKIIAAISIIDVITGQRTSQNHRFKNPPVRGEDAGRLFGCID